MRIYGIIAVALGLALVAGCGSTRYAYNKDIFQREAAKDVRGDEFLRQIRQAEIEAAEKREKEAREAADKSAKSEKSSREPAIPARSDFASS
jgi:hypothetical protein